MTYTVKYKSPHGLFWHKIKDVEGDDVCERNNNIRFFFLKDKTRVEIPRTYLFKFSKERFYDIHEHMEQEIGQSIKVKNG